MQLSLHQTSLTVFESADCAALQSKSNKSNHLVLFIF